MSRAERRGIALGMRRLSKGEGCDREQQALALEKAAGEWKDMDRSLGHSAAYYWLCDRAKALREGE